jgi:hypothetical protein
LNNGFSIFDWCGVVSNNPHFSKEYTTSKKCGLEVLCIFELPELIDCYDNNLLFLFQGLMNEHVGANIRNEIAHGLMSEAKGNDGAARFFFCWVLKLLALTARNFYEIDT